MSPSPRDYLRHFLAEAEFLVNQTASMTREEFFENGVAKRACTRSIEIIGKAAKQLPAAFREDHPDVDWRGMAGMPDIVIHEYFGVNFRIVWDVATREAPVLRDRIKAILDAQPDG
ncbi:MAG: DUF86 domain-containing protein [Planctomycetota bacterium]